MVQRFPARRSGGTQFCGENAGKRKGGHSTAEVWGTKGLCIGDLPTAKLWGTQTIREE
jgi:hypothetical protein